VDGAAVTTLRLDAFRDARLADAHRRADALVADARADAEASVARAQADVEEQIELARSDHTPEACLRERAVAAAQRRRGDALLRTQRAAYDEILAQMRRRVLQLRDEAGYRRLLDRLEALAVRQLGEGVVIERDPAGWGGVPPPRGSLSVDYTLPAMAERCMGTMAEEIEALWH
jgi:vacuolar-type H+-ATPase subunit E/Vma4